jgi:hypothetical protein
MSLIDARHLVTQPDGWTDCNPIGHAIHHSVTEIDAAATVAHTATFPSGRSYLTGRWNRARAHVKHRNHELVGSVAIGNFSSSPAGLTIIRGLGDCVRAAREVFGRQLPLGGHGQWAVAGSPSSCPGQIRNQMPAIAAAALPQEEGFLMALSDEQQLDLYNKTRAIFGWIDSGSASEYRIFHDPRDGKVWHVTRGTKRWISSMEAFVCSGYQWGEVEPLPPAMYATFSGVPEG